MTAIIAPQINTKLNGIIKLIHSPISRNNKPRRINVSTIILMSKIDVSVLVGYMGAEFKLYLTKVKINPNFEL